MRSLLTLVLSVLLTASAWAVDCPKWIGPNVNNLIEYCDVNSTSHFLAWTTSAGLIIEKNYTVATLPTCNSGVKYTHAAVSDAVACTFAATLTGGSIQACPVFCDGANWIGG